MAAKKKVPHCLVFEVPRRLLRCYLVMGLLLWIISWISFGLSLIFCMFTVLLGDPSCFLTTTMGTARLCAH